LPWFESLGEAPIEAADYKDYSKFADYDADTKFADVFEEAALGS